MEFPFPINRPAVGADFLSRRKEAEALASNMLSGRHTLIYDAPKTGKHTLIRNAFDILDSDHQQYTLVYVNAYRCRSEEALLRLFGEAVRNAFVPSEEEQETFTERYLGDTLDKLQIFSVPEIIGREKGERIIIWIDEFQNILNFDSPDTTLKMLESAILPHEHVTYLMVGSSINAMKYIFEQVGCFFNFAERIILPQMSGDDITYHITRVFQKVGRIITRGQSGEIYDYSQGNPWMAWQIANTCFNLTRGYVTEDIINEAVGTLLNSHEIRFHDIIDSLSNYQLQLLRAVFDGEIRLNSQEVIEKYGLSSSANVHRMKEALLKKEVITFDHEYRPMIIDPLFHLWLKRTYFTG